MGVFMKIAKRGFEYIVQLNKPSPETEGIEKLDLNADLGSYSLLIPELKSLEYYKEDWELTTVWWYRAVAYIEDEGQLIKKYGEWKRNTPLVETGEISTQLTLGSIPTIEVGGEVKEKGGSDIQQVGARIYYEFSGKLIDLGYYTNPASKWKIEGQLEEHIQKDENGKITLIYWTGKFYKDVYQNYESDQYTQVIGGGSFGEGLSGELLPDTNYKVMAIARNKTGWSGGAIKSIRTLPAMNWYITLTLNHLQKLYEATVSWGESPFPITRIGVKAGRTKSCNEINVYQDGQFENDSSTEFTIELLPGFTYYFMPYAVWNVLGEDVIKYGSMQWVTTDYEFPDDYVVETPPIDDDYQTTRGGSPSYNYREIVKEIYCENESDQSVIDYHGRRRSYKVANHLIQNHDDCRLIVNDYLSKYETLKLKVAVSTDILIPFEQEDYIVLGSARYPYREEGKVKFKGEIRPQPFILAKVRKTDISYQSEEAILNLELEV